MIKVVRVTKGILDSIEVAFNRTFADYFKSVNTYDENGNILTSNIDTKYISRDASRYIINSSKIRRLYNKASQEERDAISARYNNVDIIAWIDSKELYLSEVDIIRESP